MFPNSGKPNMSAAIATRYVRGMVTIESRGRGDIDGALARIESRFDLPFWPLWHLRKGRAKTCNPSFLARIKLAYFDLCLGQLETLLTEIGIERKAADDAHLENLERKARAMAEAVDAQKALIAAGAAGRTDGGRP